MTVSNASELLRERIVYRSDVSTRETRATADGQLQLPSWDSAFARRSFLYRATQSWNSLPSNVRHPAQAIAADDVMENDA